MTESSRNMSEGSETDLQFSLTERTSNMSGGTHDEDSESASTAAQSPTMAAPEKRAPEVSAEETLEKPVTSPKRRRSKKGKEQCTIQ